MRIKIDAEELNLKNLGFEVIDSPQSYNSKMKSSSMESVDFPEEQGSYYYILPTPKFESFDYPITFAYKKINSDSVATVIKTFIDKLMGKQVTIYNDDKGISIDGFLYSYTDDKYYPNTDVGFFKLIFKIADPSSITIITTP